jgi:hypothetical protein
VTQVAGAAIPIALDVVEVAVVDNVTKEANWMRFRQQDRGGMKGACRS